MSTRLVSSPPSGWIRVTPQEAALVLSLGQEVVVATTSWGTVSDGTKLIRSNTFAKPEDVKAARTLLNGIRWEEKINKEE